jgi:hypothetical protein
VRNCIGFTTSNDRCCRLTRMIAGPFDNLDPQRVSLCYVVAGLMPTTCGMIGLQKYGRRWRGKTISISCRRFVLAVIQQLRIAWTPFKLTGRAEQRLERSGEQEPLRYPLRSYDLSMAAS